MAMVRVKKSGSKVSALYAYVSVDNQKWVAREAKKSKKTISKFVNSLLDSAREKVSNG